MNRPPRAPAFRTLLILGRASNLPTVWSNCLAGFLLGGGGDLWRLLTFSLGATLLYTGGMFLNDAFDADFDHQHRSERPIPSGAIALAQVWRFGFAFLVAGLLIGGWMHRSTALLTLLLAACIVLYDAIHKAVVFAPVLMALCRFFLFLAAASIGTLGVSGLAVWSAFALAFYIIGLSYLARQESLRGPLRYWPLLCLVAPVALAWTVNSGSFRPAATALILCQLGWSGWCLYHTFSTTQRNIGHTVSGLLAGIVLVDLLALNPRDAGVLVTFCALFVGARLFQRFIPAT